MYNVQNVNSIAFRSNYIIPYKEMEKVDSAAMRQFGADSAKFITSPDNMMQTQEGIVVNIDNSRDKEYEAVIAKYGLNIHKYEGKFEPQNPTADLYAMMITKLEPQNAQAKIEAFKNMDEKSMNDEYMKVYKEYKNSPYSIEKQEKLTSSDIKPTDAPVIKFESKNGEKLMAREVVVDGYPCMAVALENNPGQTMLMNKEEFEKFFLETAKEINK